MEHRTYRSLGLILTGPKPHESRVETFRIDYPIRTPKLSKVEFTANKYRVLGFDGVWAFLPDSEFFAGFNGLGFRVC